MSATPRPPSSRGPLDAALPAWVLVVEDDDDQRDTVVDLLAAAGYEVGWARDGAEALIELEKAASPALILLDLHMAGMTGVEFLEARNRRAELRRIPVVVMTAHVVTFARGTFGVADMLMKPFGFDDLLRVVKRYAAPEVTH